MNQKDPELVERFIALRSRGVPYATIAAELGVGRTTLIRWSRTHAQRIANERAIEDELLSETLNSSRRAQLQKACALHDRIIEELSRRKLEDIPTDRLALLAFRLTRHLAPHAGGIKFSEPFTEAHLAAGDTPPPVISWEG